MKQHTVKDRRVVMEETSSLGVKDFSAKVLGQTVHFHVIRMQQSLFLWAGTKLSFKSLAVAMQTKYVSQFGMASFSRRE